MPGDRRREKALHRTFRTSHVRGEWFRPSDALNTILDACASFPHHPRRIRKFPQPKVRALDQFERFEQAVTRYNAEM